MPLMPHEKKPVIEPAKKPTDDKAKLKPLGYWLNIVKGMERHHAENVLKDSNCPPPMIPAVLQELAKVPQAVKKEVKATPVPEKPAEAPEAHAPAEPEKTKLKTVSPG